MAWSRLPYLRLLKLLRSMSPNPARGNTVPENIVRDQNSSAGSQSAKAAGPGGNGCPKRQAPASQTCAWETQTWAWQIRPDPIDIRHGRAGPVCRHAFMRFTKTIKATPLLELYPAWISRSLRALAAFEGRIPVRDCGRRKRLNARPWTRAGIDG